MEVVPRNRHNARRDAGYGTAQPAAAVRTSAVQRGEHHPDRIRAGERNALSVFDTGDAHPRLLAHVENVLVFQSMGGASDHVYVFAFRAGKPSVALRTATKDLIQVRQSKDSVVVIVPPTTYLEPDDRFPPTSTPKEYPFPVDR
jgi:hypothetical protein